MKDKTKNIIQTIIFIFIIILFLILNLIKKDEKISLSERRNLVSFSEVFEDKSLTEIGKRFDDYATDQFVFRDFFRNIKTNTEINFFRKKDYNKLFVIEDNIYKIEYPLKEKSVKNAAEKINFIKEKYLENMEVYYAIIPDKSFYLDEKYGYIKLDHERLVEIMQENIENIKYIELSDCFNKNSYYKTDLHIKQEEYEKAVNKISKSMEKEEIDFSKFEKKKITDFYGTYYGQIMKDVGKDEIICLIDENTKNSVTYNLENNQKREIYDLEKLNSKDLYDIFLSGAVPIIEITNNTQKNNDELIIFRDSFASALAPLLLKNYSKITLIDIRYVSTDILDKFIKFEKQEVLFLYNDLILNNSLILK